MKSFLFGEYFREYWRLQNTTTIEKVSQRIHPDHKPYNPATTTKYLDGLFKAYRGLLHNFLTKFKDKKSRKYFDGSIDQTKHQEGRGWIVPPPLCNEGLHIFQYSNIFQTLLHAGSKSPFLFEKQFYIADAEFSLDYPLKTNSLFYLYHYTSSVLVIQHKIPSEFLLLSTDDGLLPEF